MNSFVETKGMIVARGPRTFEANLTCPVLNLLSVAPGGALTTSALKAEIRANIPLYPGDLAASLTRNDRLIDQIVGNIVSHRNLAGNIVHSGMVTYYKVPAQKCGTLTITPLGRQHLKTNCP